MQQTLQALQREVDQAWYRDSETKAWLLADAAANGTSPAPCTKLLEQLRNLSVPASATIELTEDSRDLKQGRHALPAVRAACDKIEHAGRLEELENWAKLAAADDRVSNMKVFQNCVEAYDAYIQAGGTPSDRVPARRIYVDRTQLMWEGTVAELRARYCDAPMQGAKAELAAREAPYRKVLKADKLRLALGHNATKRFYLPGGDASMNPKKLAVAKVWFDRGEMTSDSQGCANGNRRIVVTRYVFDVQHALKSTSEKSYCSDPGRAAFR